MLITPPANPDIKRELKDQLLTVTPRTFELFAGEFLIYVGLEKVSVTRTSATEELMPRAT